jgi:uncharacterized integral membrane protein (TIGR00698 family)
MPAWVRLGTGFVVCALIASVALWAGKRAPLIGAPIFAILIGLVLTNTLRGPTWLPAMRIGDVSKLALRGGIIVLGASLDFGEILRLGIAALPLLLVVVVAGLVCALGLGRALGLDWRMRCLIGMGTTICGASAIAALSPVIKARAEEIAYSITVVFLFNMIAVVLFPVLGHLMGLSDHGFGVWAGAAINDTSAVVAAAYSYSYEAGETGTVVKLTRTMLIIPLVILFALALPLFETRTNKDDVSLIKRIYDSFPLFIVFFLIASLLQALGVFGQFSQMIQWLGRAILIGAMAAVGLQGHWKAFVGAGTGPLMLGMATWAVVAVVSLALQHWLGMI